MREPYYMTSEAVDRVNNATPRGKGKSGQMWCPYDHRWSDLVTKHGMNRLACCGSSLNDFYVKKHNHLWETKSRRKRVKAESTDDDDNDEEE